jgi:uncharacterized protein (TIGR00303 family)
LPLIAIHTQAALSQDWLTRHRHHRPHLVCVLGFTATCLIPNISAAGLTPFDRQFTALADGEFLALGIQPHYQYPLPPLQAGASPAIITRAIATALDIPITLVNAGLPQPPSFPCIDFSGQPAQCLTTGQALPLHLVYDLWEKGLAWGEATAGQLSQESISPYLVIGECVVGGTTTALAVLSALGIPATGKVNSSHPQCNHAQKLTVVHAGLQQLPSNADPWQIIATLGDPMQIVVAGMALAASKHCGVLLAGGTQMIAVYALMQALAQHTNYHYLAHQIVVGTTGWVATDDSADAVGLAAGICPLISAALQFGESRYPQLQVYDRGFVKEGVGAGGAAIAAALYRDWHSSEVLTVTENLLRLIDPLG